jgi:hypothetical protein
MNTDADTLSRLPENMRSEYIVVRALRKPAKTNCEPSSSRYSWKTKVKWLGSHLSPMIPLCCMEVIPSKSLTVLHSSTLVTFDKLSLKIMLLEKFIRLSTENSDQLPLREQQHHPILNSYFMNGQSCLLIKTTFYGDRTTHTIRLCFLDHTIEQFYVNFTITWLTLDLSASYTFG